MIQHGAWKAKKVQQATRPVYGGIYSLSAEFAYQKGLELLRNGVMLVEFGTRRRRSLETHGLVLEGLIRAHKELSNDPEIKGRLVGTSNVRFPFLASIAS